MRRRPGTVPNAIFAAAFLISFFLALRELVRADDRAV